MPADFGRVARVYRWLEYGAFGGALGRRRVAYLPALAGARRVLELGGGDGRFLESLLRANPGVEVDYVEASPAMVALARRRAAAAGGGGRVRFHEVDMLTAAPGGGPYDAVVTHFVLDCFEDGELGGLGRRVTQWTGPGASWIVSEFQARPGVAGGWVVGFLYRFFGWTTGLRTRRLPDHRGMLRSAGWELAASEEAWAGLLVSEHWRTRR